MTKTSKTIIKKQTIILNDFISLIKKEKTIQLIGPCECQHYIDHNLFPKIFIDGGSRHFNQFNSSQNTLFVGDGDSSTAKMHIKYSTNKDESDLKCVLDLLKIEDLILFLDGLTPQIEKRIDHLLAIFGDCYQHSKDFNSTFFINDKITLLPSGEHSLHYRGNFGLISIEKTKLKLIGKIKYELTNETTINALSSFTISNEAKGEFKLMTNRPIFLIKT